MSTGLPGATAVEGPPTDPRAVYAKTEAGRLEIVDRRHGLSAAARRVLILIDGRVPMGDLPRHARPGDLEGIVGLLDSLGLIERVGTAEAAGPLASANEQRTLTDVKRDLASLFEGELGVAGIVADARVQDSVSLDLMRRVLRESIETVQRRYGHDVAQRLALRARHLRLFESSPHRRGEASSGPARAPEPPHGDRASQPVASPPDALPSPPDQPL